MTDIKNPDSPQLSSLPPIPKTRIISIDAFRGFTVLAMIFVIQVAGYKNLPLSFPQFGSPVVSTFLHAEAAYPEGTPKEGKIGCTFTDLVAPFFVFIVGLCIPLSRKRRGVEWWRHVLTRTFLLYLLGVVYISLVLKLSYWWGILQAIAVAYFIGSVMMVFPAIWRWVVVAVIAIFHSYMSVHFRWWQHIGNEQMPFLTIENLIGDPLRPLTVHCTPWASISWGLITIVGTLLGESLLSRSHKKIITSSLIIGIALTVIGYIIHRINYPVYAMNKETVSSSYAIFTSGISALTFLIFYIINDIIGWVKWAVPFTVFGSNALLGYFMQPVVRIFITALGFRGFFIDKSGWMGVYMGLVWTALLWVVVLWFNKKKIYWRI